MRPPCPRSLVQRTPLVLQLPFRPLAERSNVRFRFKNNADVFTGRSGRPGAGWSGDRWSRRRPRTDRRRCRTRPPWRPHRCPPPRRPDTFPRPATTAPGDDGEPADTAGGHRWMSHMWGSTDRRTFTSVPSLQCHTRPSTRPSGLSWNHERSCWKSTGGGRRTGTPPCGTRKWSGCFLEPSAARRTTGLQMSVGLKQWRHTPASFFFWVHKSSSRYLDHSRSQ